jgi:FKBP-type peptidyl-prolyl cis-trans isomerase FkpA
MKRVWIVFISLGIILLSICLLDCGHRQQGNEIKDPGNYKEPLIKANQEAVRQENQQIDDFIHRHQLEMQATNTGLRYLITKKGIGPAAVPGRTVKLSYAVTLLTGDTVYTAQKDGPMIFEIGKGQVISGLEEGILLLHVGDHVKFIIPSHLAYGLIGDQNKILHKASLVYDIEFINMF